MLSNHFAVPDRRRLLMLGGGLALGSLLPSPAQAARQSSPKICAFVKFLQSLSHKQLAAEIKRMGFDGIEATVRKGGQVEPARAEQELPALVAELKEKELEISVMASDINRADDPLSERVLRTAARLGVKRYRMKYYRYRDGVSLTEQLRQLKPVVRDLAQLNAELGMQAVYQNHSGARNVGAAVWDLAELLADVDPRHVAVAFDIRHATVEGGLAWGLHFRRIRPHLGVVYVKDFVWEQAKRRPRNVPLGEGLVDPAFFTQLRKLEYDGVVSLHVEYLGKESVERNLQALQTDLDTLRKLLSTSNS